MVFGVGCGWQAIATTDALPVARVVVYRNGVAYFERAGHVEESEVHHATHAMQPFVERACLRQQMARQIERVDRVGGGEKRFSKVPSCEHPLTVE